MKGSREKGRESGSKRGRGRKREDILRGRTVIYEQATSKGAGGGGHSFSNKTKGSHKEEQKERDRDLKKQNRATVRERKSWREVGTR